MGNEPRLKKSLPLLLFAALLTLDVVGYLLDRVASRHGSIADATGLHFYRNIVTQPWIWMAFALGPLQLLTWTRILKTTDLSLAYPITSLNSPVTMLVAQIMWQEHLSAAVWIGAILITAGVVVLGKDTHDVPPIVV